VSNSNAAGSQPSDQRRAGARNVLMWSHYAASHAGVCFKFHVARDPTVLGLADPVEYNDTFLAINWTERDTAPSKLGKVILRKTTAWSYEHERRLVETYRANTSLPFNPAALQRNSPWVHCFACHSTSDRRIVSSAHRKRHADSAAVSR